MINLDKSENWSGWEDWTKTKKVYFGSKTGLQVYGGIKGYDLLPFTVNIQGIVSTRVETVGSAVTN